MVYQAFLGLFSLFLNLNFLDDEKMLATAERWYQDIHQDILCIVFFFFKKRFPTANYSE
jgi:hypothetical protein